MSKPAKSKIFISYRRDDSAATAGRIYDRLVARFGREAIFKDVDANLGAKEFAAYILREVLPQCAVEIVLIGPRWLDIQSADGTRRLEQPDDLVRQEIEGALELGIPILPLLVQSTEKMPPREELPESLRGILRYSALLVRYDPDFSHDIGRVIATLEPLLENLSSPPPASGDVVGQLQAWIAASFAAEDWPDVELRAELLIRQAPLAATAQVYLMYASALRMLGKLTQALPILRDALALSTDQDEQLMILTEYAKVQATLGEWEDLTRTSDRALRLAPDELGWLEWRLRALTALTARPGASAAEWLARGQIEFDMKQYAEAQQSLSTAHKLAPDDVSITRLQAELFPLPRMPHRLVELGFRGMNIMRTPVIIPPMVPVPAGEFLMGSDKRRDPQAMDNELPQHSVMLAAFNIGKFPVTMAEYACFLRAGQSQASNWEIEILEQKHMANSAHSLDHPVVNVSWYQATAYAAWLAKLTGQPWRLPTEAEWEKAARWDPARRQARLYPWGDRWDETRANTSKSGMGTTTPVGTYTTGASPYGALDMAGNVWEYTSSLFRSYPYIQSVGGETQNAAGNWVLRGGSWFGLPRLARAACRVAYVHGYFMADDGFRLVLAAS